MLSPQAKAKRHETMLRIDKDLHDQIAAVAKEEARSVNQQILYFVKQGLNARKTLSPTDTIVNT